MKPRNKSIYASVRGYRIVKRGKKRHLKWRKHHPLMSLLSLALLGCLAFLAYCAWRRRTPGGVSSPPGPRGVPFFGLVRNIPHEHAWLTYAEWAKKYGDVMYFKTFGQPMIVLSSLKAATDLLEKRSTIYSGRPRLVCSMAALLHG